MQTAAPYLTAAATGVQVASQIFGGMQSQGAGNAEMAIGQRNAQLDQTQAQNDASDMAIKNREAMGTIRANAGASGLVVTDGSPLDVLLSSAKQGALNVQRRLWQGDVQAQNDLITGGVGQARGNSAATGSFVNAGASLLNGVSKAASLFGFGGTGTGTGTAGYTGTLQGSGGNYGANI